MAGNLNGVKPNERVVKYSEVEWSKVEVLGIGCLSILDNIQTILCFTASFIFFWFYYVSLYI